MNMCWFRTIPSLLLVSLLLVVGFVGQSQAADVTGVVVDETSLDRLVGANVVLLDERTGG